MTYIQAINYLMTTYGLSFDRAVMRLETISK